MKQDNYLIDLYNSLKGISKASFSAFITNTDNTFFELRQSFRKLNQSFIDSRWRDSVSVLVESNYEDVDLMISKRADYSQNVILPLSEQCEILANRLNKYYVLVNQNNETADLEICAKECYETINNINGLLNNNVGNTQTQSVSVASATVEEQKNETTSTTVEASQETIPPQDSFESKQTDIAVYDGKCEIKKDGDNYYFYKPDGSLASSGWIKNDRTLFNNKYYILSDSISYVKEDGSLAVSEWLKLDDKWYHFNVNGYMDRHEIIKDGDNYYYLQSDGTMACNGWFKDSNNNWYYAREDGSLLAKEWIKEDDKWYYFNRDGIMDTNDRIKDGDNYYYLQSDGTMACNGWVYDEKHKEWYYANEDGSLVTNNWVQDGDKSYFMGSSGSIAKNKVIYEDNNGNFSTAWWVSGWKEKDVKKLIFVDENGNLASDGWHKKVDNSWVYSKDGWQNTYNNNWVYSKDGKLVTNDWIIEGDATYYVDSGGHMVTNNTVQKGSTQYYFDESGKMVRNKGVYHESDDTTYFYGSNGAYLYFKGGDWTK